MSLARVFGGIGRPIGRPLQRIGAPSITRCPERTDDELASIELVRQPGVEGRPALWTLAP